MCEINAMIDDILDKLKVIVPSDKSITDQLTDLQFALLKTAIDIEVLLSHNNPTHEDVLSALTAISNKFDDIAFTEDAIDDIQCNLHKMIALLDEKRIAE